MQQQHSKSLAQFIKKYKHLMPNFETLRSIISGDNAEKLGNQFLTEWNIVKMKYIGKCILFFFTEIS
jgi:hypothetical protein